jgi:hypothetical protein
VVALSIFILASHTMNVATLIEYSAQVVAARTGKAPLLLRFHEGAAEELQQDGILAECLLDFNTIADCMKEAGKDIMGMIPLQVKNLIFVCNSDLYKQLLLNFCRVHSMQINGILGLTLRCINLPLLPI